tara:strand:- start:6330 stop:6902 length:573 start_codon:yes stop_codon:yes gene_type:complete
MTWFALWKSNKANLMRDYNCDVCVFSGLYKRRTCFLYDVFPDKHEGHKTGDFFNIPRFRADHVAETDETGIVKGEVRFLDGESFLEMLWELSEALPHFSAFQILNAYFAEVCPTAFNDHVCSAILSAQASASDYTVDISDDNVRYDLLGFHMTLSDVLEAFNIIVGTRNSYERYEMEKMEKKSNETMSKA